MSIFNILFVGCANGYGDIPLSPTDNGVLFLVKATLLLMALLGHESVSARLFSPRLREAVCFMMGVLITDLLKCGITLIKNPILFKR